MGLPRRRTGYPGAITSLGIGICLLAPWTIEQSTHKVPSCYIANAFIFPTSNVGRRYSEAIIEPNRANRKFRIEKETRGGGSTASKVGRLLAGVGDDDRGRGKPLSTSMWKAEHVNGTAIREEDYQILKELVRKRDAMQVRGTYACCLCL